MKVDGTPCPYCGKQTFSRTHLGSNGESYVECYTEDGGCGRPYVVYVPITSAQSRKLTEEEIDKIEYIYPWHKTLNMSDCEN